ncbi:MULTISPECIES: GTP-binding protein [Vitreoscilla]|uniref:ATP/GTP-binding protein n=1 Tax=Vitreoscilla stercoraria TaxID=61 RepID=A0ABY4ECA7_VITST|nr:MULTISPECIES: ATP/GTP-binding protein [Vitreoscilla]AUZ05602.2 hypothetical protein ADP71_21980 [Vitreoscilla sp. C1]UOO92983.1 ATP/GTP-binding protein [Vitreoscilla stercoraria]
MSVSNEPNLTGPLLKILFIGPMGAGKTTAIHCISDTNPIGTEASNSDSEQSNKSTTTVAMDYGSIELGPDEVVHLYGIPGQDRFKFMWPILAKGSMGCILLIDDTRENPIEDLKLYLHEFRDLISKQAFVVGIGKTKKDSHALDKYTQYFAERDMYAPIMEVDVREKADVLMLLEVILANSEIKGE